MRVFIALILTIFNSCVRGQNFIATYGFLNVTTSSGLTDPGPAPVVENLIMGNFRAANVGSNPGASGRFSFSNWPVGAQDGADDYALYNSSLSPFTYYEIGIRIAPNHTLELKSISFYVRRSGTGIRNYCVRSTLDNYSSNISASTGTNSNLSVIEDEVFFWKYDSLSTSSDQRGSTLLLNKDFRELTDTIAFRFYAWNAEATGGTFSIDNVTFSGYVKDSVFFAGTPDRQQLEKALLFPNPVSGNYFTLQCTTEINDVFIEDLTGRILIHKKPANENVQIDTADLTPGVYMITVWSQNGQVKKKFVTNAGN